MMLPDPLGGILSGGSRFDMGFKRDFITPLILCFKKDFISVHPGVTVTFSFITFLSKDVTLSS